MIAGIAGGLAEYFKVDVSLVRLLWVLAFFIGGGGFFAYLVAWIIIPEASADPSHTYHTFFPSTHFIDFGLYYSLVWESSSLFITKGGSNR